jgi:esterase/lipase
MDFGKHGVTTSTSSLSQSYEESLARITALLALDDEQVNPLCRTSLLTHGSRTERAILMLHGYTNNPRQYHILAGQFFQRGYNVFVPRFPGHGLNDRMTTALQDQTETGLLSFTNNALDLAQGLGRGVTVLGFSMGGVLTLWLAQHRADVALACAVSPALAFHAIPLPLTPIVTKYLLAAPNQFRWWDPQAKDAPVPPLHAYPRYSARGLAHIVNIGLKVRTGSRHSKPMAGSVLVVTNPTDESVNNAYGHEIVTNWKALGCQNIRTYEFDPSLNLIHDLMEPDQPKQQIEIVYPILLDLITN